MLTWRYQRLGIRQLDTMTFKRLPKGLLRTNVREVPFWISKMTGNIRKILSVNIKGTVNAQMIYLNPQFSNLYS